MTTAEIRQRIGDFCAQSVLQAAESLDPDQPGTQVFRSVDEYPDSETYPGLVVMRFDSGLFFASADALDGVADFVVAQQVVLHHGRTILVIMNGSLVATAVQDNAA